MSDWRNTKNVLVDEAEHNIGVGVIRSLGRAGYRVTACSSQRDALGFLSRYVGTTLVCPSPFEREAFLAWLDRTIDEHRIDTILGTEGLLTAIEPVYDKYADLLPYGPDGRVLYDAMAKAQLVGGFLDATAPAALREHIPPSLIVGPGVAHPGSSSLGHLPLPIYIKADFLNSSVGAPSRVHRATDRVSAAALLSEQRAQYDRLLVQGHVDGVGVGVFAVVHDGRILARFMHQRLHEYPHTGGVSSYRRSWWHEAIYADARARLRHLGWQGPIMLEYRWNPLTDEFWLLEANCRFWGSLHLALHAGVDFPRIMVDALHGRVLGQVPEFPLAARCRDTFPTEARHVGSRLRDPDLGIGSKAWSVLRFLLLTLDPRVRADLLFPGDRGLYRHAFTRYIRELVLSRVRRRLDVQGGRAPSWAKGWGGGS